MIAPITITRIATNLHVPEDPTSTARAITGPP
jgi:hypothetical protein